MPKASKNRYLDKLKFPLTSPALLATNYKMLISVGFWHIRHIIYKKNMQCFDLVYFIVLAAALKGKPS
jgi:hypothetical protein